MKRERKGDVCNYDIFYKMDDGTYVLYAINFDTAPPSVINAYPALRNYEQFKKYVVKKIWQTNDMMVSGKWFVVMGC